MVSCLASATSNLYEDEKKLGICLIDFGASPRASIALALAAKAHAYLQGRAYVTPQDVKNIGFEVLRQRVIVSFEAEAEEMTSDDIIKIIFDSIEVP